MRFSDVVAIAIATSIAGCAGNPVDECGSVVPAGSTYLPEPPHDAAGLKRLVLPPRESRPPKSTEDTPIFRIAWYQKDDGLFACALPVRPSDYCGAVATEFRKRGEMWVFVNSQFVVCN